MLEFRDIFTWKDLEEWGEFKIFHTCVLVRDVGDFEKGYAFDRITFNDEELTLNNEELTLRFYEEDEVLVMVKKLGMID